MTDRRCQYCSAAYVAELNKHNIMISMTQSGDQLENAIAERTNGILKTEWLYKMNIPTIEKCKEELECILLFYNTEHPHISIDNKTPDVVHGETHGFLLNLHSEDDNFLAYYGIFRAALPKQR